MPSTSPSHHAQRGRPPTAEAQSPAARMRRYRARQRAAGLRAVTRYEPPPRVRLSSGELDRRITAARDLALHCLAAKKIDADRTLLPKVRSRLEYWCRNCKEETPSSALGEWAEVLSSPWSAIALFITDLAPEAARLRRFRPFDIVLTARETQAYLLRLCSLNAARSAASGPFGEFGGSDENDILSANDNG